MHERRRIWSMTLIMISTCFLIGALIIFVLYQASLEERRTRLSAIVSLQARMIEATARYDVGITESLLDEHPSFDAAVATIGQIESALENYTGFGKTSEFALARRDVDDITFLFRTRLGIHEYPEPVDFKTDFAVPMHNALSGQSGTWVGTDYRGETVMAAYEPVAVLHLGLVGTVDISELRADFFPAMLLALVGAMLCTAVAVTAFQRLGNPVIRRLSEQAVLLEGQIASQRAADAELKKWNMVIENAGWGIAIADARTDELIAVNPAYARMHGYGIEELGKTNLAELSSENDKALLADRARLVHEEGGLTFDSVHVRKDGSSFPVTANVHAIYDEQGEVLYRAANYQDITEQKALEDSLKSAKLMLECSIESAEGMVVLAIDRDYHYLFFNQLHHATMKHVYGADVEVGECILDHVNEDGDREKLRKNYERVLAGESFTIIDEFGDVNRTFFEVLFNPIRTPEGEILGIVVFAMDISERKRVERELENSLKRYSTLANLAPVGFYETDKDGAFTYANAYWLEMAGVTLQEALGDGWAEAVHPDDRQLISERWRRMIETEGDWGQEFRFQTPAGKVTWVYGVATPLRGDQGEISCYIGANTNISDHKKNARERRDLERQILQAQKMESLGILAGGIAHDFNNLLMTILGNADMIQQDLAVDAEVNSSIDMIVVAARRATELSNQMLVYSGKGQLVTELTNLNSMMQEMGDLLDVSRSKKAELKYEFAEDLPHIQCDVTQVRQIIMNLIINASEAIGDQRGEIRVSTGTQYYDHENSISVENLSFTGLDNPPVAGLYAYLEVTDTGCGMTAEIRDRIFDPFFTTKFAGRGLGMAAILGIVRGHHGMIEVRSEVNKGTTIKVLFPTAAKGFPDIAATGSVQQIVDWQGEGLTLIADDDESVLKLTKRYMELLGFDVVTAVDGKEAIELFQKHEQEIVCVLLDMTMPHIGGKEAFRRIREMREDARVILCSGYNEQAIDLPLLGEGIAGFLQKPYSLGELRDKLMLVLDPTV